MFRALSTFCLVVICGCARAQPSDAEIAARRGVLERQQQSEEFSLRLQQSQRRLQAPPGVRAARDSAELEQLLEQDRLHQSQLLRSPLPGVSDQTFERERRAQALSSSGIPTWGPTLAPVDRWTPTLEKPRRRWTPTIDDR